MRVPRSLLFGIGLAALALGADLRTPALAANATLRGETMPAGFARLSLSFDEQTTTRIRVGNGVLVVAFGAPVNIDVAKIARELPEHISVARVDPDRRGMRFALARPYRTNLIEVGDRVFIDLLPENWRGVLPGPPAEALAEMVERLRLAEARAQDAARRAPAPRKTLTLRSAKLPTLERMIFQASPDTTLKPELAGGALTLTFDEAMTVDEGALKAALPDGVTLVSHATEGRTTRLALAAPGDWQLRSFKDEDGLTVDLVKAPKAEAMTLAALQAAANAQAIAVPTGPAAPAQAQLAAVAAGAQAPPPAPAQAAPPAAPDPTPKPVIISAEQIADGGRIDFQFPRITGAAAFVDAGIVTLVFDTRDYINPVDFKAVLPRLIEDTTVSREGKVTLVRFRLASQQLVRLLDDGATWSLALGDVPGKPAEPVAPRRAMDERGQSIISVALPGMTGVHWLDAGSTGLPMAVATATGPTRSLVKPYQFVEFALLQTAHGIAVTPRADDVVVRAEADEARIGRAAGLTVTLDLPEQQSNEGSKAPVALPALLDTELWSKARAPNIRDRTRALMSDVTDASLSRKSEARLALARFYAANGLMTEALGPLAALMADDPAMRSNREALFLKALAATRMHRNAEAMAAFNAGALKDDVEAGLWKALVEQRMGRNAEALLGFRRAEPILARYPAEQQAELRPAIARAALAMQDLLLAEQEIAKLTAMPSDQFSPAQAALLRAMLDDANGRPEAALNGYKALFESADRPVAAEAQLRAVKLVQAEKRTDMTPDEAMARLETVAIIWRGGQVEIEALAELGRLYIDNKRWRDAFLIARRANEMYVDHPLTRRMHDETAQRFADLFSAGGDNALPRLEALAVFYDFKEFLPVGRRGDEITRLLADRLVELDLLDQAAEILRYQMDRRLTGAARSTVAARLAMINLMNAKPVEALQALNSTRLLELPADVQRARLLLEAKALSDLSRTDQALELLESERGTEIDRLRADIFWTGRRWREAGESHERLLGESWRGTGALTDNQRSNVMRAAISYVMANETLSLDRLRAKFAGKMAQSSDARTFAFVTGASRARPADIREMARAAAGADSLSDFMNAYRERYPGFAAPVRQRPAPEQPAPAGEPGAAAAAGQPGRG